MRRCVRLSWISGIDPDVMEEEGFTEENQALRSRRFMSRLLMKRGFYQAIICLNIICSIMILSHGFMFPVQI